MEIIPYLFIEGRCEEALKFYQSAVDAELGRVMRFKDSPEPEHCPPGSEEKIMHAEFRIGKSLIMVSDGCSEGEAGFKGFALSITPDTEEQAERYFAALADGGKVEMPLGKTFWSPKFGMVTDRFGIMWMVNIAAT